MITAYTNAEVLLQDMLELSYELETIESSTNLCEDEKTKAVQKKIFQCELRCRKVVTRFLEKLGYAT